MKNIFYMFFCIVFLALFACEKSKTNTAVEIKEASYKAQEEKDHPHGEEGHQHEEEHGHGHGHEHGTKENEKGQILQLSSDALRDLRLTTRKVEKRPAGDTVTAFGSLELDPNSLVIVSTPVVSRILRIEKTLGEKVEVGDPLVELESFEFGRARLAVETAKSRVAISQKRLDLAQKQRDKFQELASAKMATVRDLQTADAELALRSADVSEAELQLWDAERAVAFFAVEPSNSERGFVLRSTIAGTIIFRDGSLGESVEANHVFYKVGNMSSLIAVAHPFERDGVRIDSQASAQISSAAHPGKIFTASFLRSDPQVNSESRTLPIRLSVPNAEGLLLPGMSVSAEIRLSAPSSQEVVTVPIAALQKIEQDWCVFIPLGKGRFERRAIARGRDLGGEVEVIGGLSQGDEIVVEGAFVLRSESTRGEDTGDEHHH